MACDDKDPDCQPCKDCDESPDPVLPRCNNALDDGTYTNATVTVDGGCIIRVETGEPPVYDPDECCTAAGSGDNGSGDEPCDCPPGEDGENATIHIGSVQSAAPGTPPSVTNSGSETDAVLNIVIPRGDDGNDGASGSGVTDNTAGIKIKDGTVQHLPIDWPPILSVAATSEPTSVTFTATKDDSTGLLTLDIDLTSYDSQLRAWVTQQINNAVNPLVNHINSLQSQVDSLEATVADCCGGGGGTGP